MTIIKSEVPQSPPSPRVVALALNLGVDEHFEGGCPVGEGGQQQVDVVDLQHEATQLLRQPLHVHCLTPNNNTTHNLCIILDIKLHNFIQVFHFKSQLFRFNQFRNTSTCFDILSGISPWISLRLILQIAEVPLLPSLLDRSNLSQISAGFLLPICYQKRHQYKLVYPYIYHLSLFPTCSGRYFLQSFQNIFERHTSKYFQWN